MVSETPSKALRVSIPKRWLPMLVGAACVLLLLAWYAFTRSAGGIAASAPAALAAFSARALSAGAAFFSKHALAEFAVEADELVAQARVYRGRHVLRKASKFQLRSLSDSQTRPHFHAALFFLSFSPCTTFEFYSNHASMSCPHILLLHAHRTIDVFESESSGHILLLNHSIAVVEAEEAAHHELMVNVAMSYLPAATRYGAFATVLQFCKSVCQTSTLMRFSADRCLPLVFTYHF
jgi:hypothetical protein